MSTIDRPYSPHYICHHCSQTFHLRTSFQLHYFCNARTNNEIEEDKAIIAEAKQQSRPLSIFRYMENTAKFKEWVEEVKKMIYEQPRSSAKSYQVHKTFQELLSLRTPAVKSSNTSSDPSASNTSSYVFNECIFLFPELKGLPTPEESFGEIVEVIESIEMRFPIYDREISLVQQRYMAITFNWIHIALCKDLTKINVPFSDLTNFLQIIPSFTRRRILPTPTPSANSNDPDRYKKLTVLVEPF